MQISEKTTGGRKYVINLIGYRKLSPMLSLSGVQRVAGSNPVVPTRKAN
jgi:hypothetical protein